jgi:hydroxylamine reductase
MFCYQCEQTAQGQGCQQIGTCGKDETTAALQDALVEVLKGVSMYAHRARQAGLADQKIDGFVVEALFATLTNVNFDPERLVGLIASAVEMRDAARRLYERACKAKGTAPATLRGPAVWQPGSSVNELAATGQPPMIPVQIQTDGAETGNLKQLILYGVKGVAAYTEHAKVLGFADSELYAAIHELLDFLTWPAPTLDQLLAQALRTGEINLRAMELLDQANTETFGHPQPAKVRVQPKKGKAILISGHDLADLQALLEQTKGLGINVYTHGEMLPAHGYPKFKARNHLAGNYGGAWQDQAKEFDAFPGPILMTTNCIQQPKESYKARLFTCGPVAWPGVQHLAERDFSPVIAAALAAPGFDQDGTNEEITVGFGRQAVMGVAGKVIEAVKAGAIKRFFLIGGCDGARPGRDYYTELAEAVPKDCVILTLACGKYRFNKLDFGAIGGIPRLLDIGQCNDAYSAIQIAVALGNAFGVGVNDLPLSLVLSWYEQKAVSILLTLLHLGIKNIRIGPTLPAFITPTVLKVLQEKFNLMPITQPQQDLAAIFN